MGREDKLNVACCLQIICFTWMLLKRGTGNGERGMGNGEWGMATCGRDYAGLMFELTLTLTLTLRVRVSSNIKPA